MIPTAPTAPPYSAAPVVYDPADMTMKVFYNGYWQTLNLGSPNLSPAVVSWIQQKYVEDQQLQVLIASHPGLRDAKQAYDVMLVLAKNSSPPA